MRSNESAIFQDIFTTTRRLRNCSRSSPQRTRRGLRDHGVRPRNFYLGVLRAPSAASVTKNYARTFAKIDRGQPTEFGLKPSSGRAATAAVLTTLPKNLHVFAEDPDRHESVLLGIIFERQAVYQVRISPRRGVGHQEPGRRSGECWAAPRRSSRRDRRRRRRSYFHASSKNPASTIKPGQRALAGPRRSTRV